MIEEDLIILAEDDDNHKYLFERAFSKVAGGERLLIFREGESLMDYLQNELNPLPRVVFLDIHMPGISGLDCLKEIRENDRLVDLPVVIHSTSNDNADERQALLYKANFYLRKSGDPEELRYIIGKVLQMDWSEKILRPFT
jgi:CheY-like chemotaxis protein